MGHYYSEMIDPSPIYTTKRLEDEKSLKNGKRIMKNGGYWRKKGKCYLVTYHEMTGDDRKWYEIHCKKKVCILFQLALMSGILFKFLTTH